MNIGHTNVKSYLTSVKRTRELQVERQWNQIHALMPWLTFTKYPEEGYLDTSTPDLSLRAYKSSKKGNNPELSNYRESMEGGHSDAFKKAMEKG